MKPSQCTIKPLLHKQWISSRGRAGEPKKKKNPTIHPWSHGVYLVWCCSRIQSSPGKPPQSQARYSLQSKTFKSAKWENRIQWESSQLQWLWFHAPSRISLVTETHLPNPHPCFSIVPAVFPFNGGQRTWLWAESGHHTKEGEPPLAVARGEGKNIITWQELYLPECVLLMWFHSWGKMLLYLYNIKLCNNTSSTLLLCQPFKSMSECSSPNCRSRGMIAQRFSPMTTSFLTIYCVLCSYRKCFILFFTHKGATVVPTWLIMKIGGKHVKFVLTRIPHVQFVANSQMSAARRPCFCLWGAG